MITIDQLVPHLLDPASLAEEAPPSLGMRDRCYRLAPVILHDDPAAADRARELLASITCRLPDDVEVQPAFWRFEQMDHGGDRSRVLSAVAATRLIILSASGNASRLPETAVDRWRTCLAERCSRGTAVIVLLGREGCFDGPESPCLRSLREAAHDAGVKFFAPGPPLDHARPATVESVHDREAAMTPTLYGILHHPPDIAVLQSHKP